MAAAQKYKTGAMNRISTIESPNWCPDCFRIAIQSHQNGGYGAFLRDSKKITWFIELYTGYISAIYHIDHVGIYPGKYTIPGRYLVQKHMDYIFGIPGIYLNIFYSYKVYVYLNMSSSGDLR